MFLVDGHYQLVPENLCVHEDDGLIYIFEMREGGFL